MIRGLPNVGNEPLRSAVEVGFIALAKLSELEDGRALIAILWAESEVERLNLAEQLVLQ